MFSTIRLAASLLVAMSFSAGAEESLGGPAGPRIDENRATQGLVAPLPRPARQAERTQFPPVNPGTITGGM